MQQHRILVQYCWVAVVLEVEKLVVVVVMVFVVGVTARVVVPDIAAVVVSRIADVWLP